MFDLKDSLTPFYEKEDCIGGTTGPKTAEDLSKRAKAQENDIPSLSEVKSNLDEALAMIKTIAANSALSEEQITDIKSLCGTIDRLTHTLIRAHDIEKDFERWAKKHC
ncbi:MAG TPA: hypothetical protein DIC60_00080 [Lachnospiraceae bacterium]|nr:hypothetical protein [Lachnospiraceae bacterium]